MDAPLPTTILLLAERAETARSWAKILDNAETAVWRTRPRAGGGRPDLIVTDRSEIDARGQDDCGIVRIGVEGPADVQLSADCSESELRLACRLLAQIVRLRRGERLAAEIHRTLAVQAMTDPLTELPNRRAWDAGLRERLALAADGSRQLCLAIFDLDHFKQINDVYGHAIGDGMLRASGRAIDDNLRQDDFVARLGGDEFGMLLWVPDAEVAAAVVERVRISLPTFYSRTALPTLTASVGYRLTGHADAVGTLPSAEALYRAADASLREAKRLGRNRSMGP